MFNDVINRAEIATFQQFPAQPRNGRHPAFHVHQTPATASNTRVYSDLSRAGFHWGSTPTFRSDRMVLGSWRSHCCALYEVQFLTPPPATPDVNHALSSLICFSQRTSPIMPIALHLPFRRGRGRHFVAHATRSHCSSPQ